MEKAMHRALGKAGLKPTDLDWIISGDLLNQLGAASYAGRTLDRPFFGIFGACSAWAESMTLAAMLVDGGFAERVGVATSSHHEAAERQFRYPVELGNQRPPTATWTVTGAGAAIVAAAGDGPCITHATPGRLVDMGIKDPFDLGSAMAPAAADTIEAHGRIQRMLLVSTGAMFGPTTFQQGESIPGIAYAVAIEHPAAEAEG